MAGDQEQFQQLLSGLLSPDNEIRKQAEVRLLYSCIAYHYLLLGPKCLCFNVPTIIFVCVAQNVVTRKPRLGAYVGTLLYKKRILNISNISCNSNPHVRIDLLCLQCY